MTEKSFELIRWIYQKWKLHPQCFAVTYFWVIHCEGLIIISEKNQPNTFQTKYLLFLIQHKWRIWNLVALYFRLKMRNGSLIFHLFMWIILARRTTAGMICFCSIFFLPLRFVNYKWLLNGTSSKQLSTSIGNGARPIHFKNKQYTANRGYTTSIWTSISNTLIHIS